MSQMEDKIGVFDSGVGGISTLRELVKELPNEKFLYFGDSIHAPYGIRSKQEIHDFTVANVEWLFDQSAKAVVIACNTATSVAIDTLRTKYPNRIIIGMEPALKPAVEYRKQSNIIVMATPTTLREEKFKHLMEEYKEEANIIPVASSELVKFVEADQIHSEELKVYLKNLFAPYEELTIDSVVLGCTHYPFAKTEIEQAFSYPVAIFDGAAGTARETRRQLEQMHLLCENGQGSVELHNSLESEIPTAKRLLEYAG